MKPQLLEKLIKKTKREIDESRLEKVKIESQIDQLNQKLQELESELEREQEIAAVNIEARQTYENFYKTSKVRQMRIRQEILDCQTQVTEVEDRLFEQFKSYKQFEILLKKHQKQELDKLTKEESKLLDEIGLQRKRFAG